MDVPVAAPRAARWIAVTTVGCILLVTGLVVLAGDQHRTVGRIESAERAAIFERAQVDVRETCRRPEAAREPLRQHCLNQAAFLLLFPACDVNCQWNARHLLPLPVR